MADLLIIAEVTRYLPDVGDDVRKIQAAPEFVDTLPQMENALLVELPKHTDR